MSSRELEYRLQSIERDVRGMPSRFVGSPVADSLVLQVIGGQNVSGIDMIKFAATVTPTALWDPNVNTSGYDNGLGYGYLFINGAVQVSKVLIRHSFYAHLRPVPSGARLRVAGTEVLTYSGSPMTAYIFDWM